MTDTLIKKVFLMKLSNQLKNKILERLKSLNPKKIILFGSYAYGEPDKDSDIDLLILKDKVKSKVVEMYEARKTLKGILMPFDTIVATQKEYDFYKTQAGSIYKEADKKGIVLYER